jgi:N-acetylglucosamine kinase-like BadF-type ATPase
MTGFQLIVDSGATKTEWRVLGENEAESIFSSGISPYHMSKEQIVASLLKELPKSMLDMSFNSIYYYGTGCYTAANAGIVKKALQEVFSAEMISVTHDLMGAAIALCGNEKGIACILGTGSNSCSYDGKKIVKNSPGLGYVLGDEGSGAYLGKKVIQHFLYETFDAGLMEAFREAYQTDKAEILQKVYKEPFANRYLASFTKFLSARRGHFMIENIIEDGLRDFFNQHILRYPQHDKTPIHFVGSIAFFFKDKIADLCSDFGLTQGTIIKQPMDGLAAFHRS